MLRSVKALQKYKVQLQNELLGNVEDLYFDDKDWVIRYLVIDTGSQMSGRKILLSPTSIYKVDDSEVIFVKLTREEVENSPDFNTDKPISRQLKEQIIQHYGWPMYWKNSGLLIDSSVLTEIEMAEAAAVSSLEQSKAETLSHSDPHLRSVKEVFGYNIQARDDEAGHLDDFIVGDKSWRVNYMIVDTGNWLSSHKVLVSPSLVERVDWLDAKVQIDLTQDTIHNSPNYDPLATMDDPNEA
ncbi:MAG: PRC-barrel domain-containing protein [Anaerolineae bacterium]|nr:PRC-barrel domain-containing protein [Anaerolineae bacterium]